MPSAAVAQLPMPSAQQIELVLEQLEAPALDFPKGCSMREYLDLISTTLKRNSPVEPAIVPDVLELELENINSLDEIILPTLQVNDSLMTIMDQFDLVCSMTDEPQLAVIAQDGILLVTTAAKAQEILVSRTYPVLDILNLEDLPPRGSDRTKRLREALTDLVSIVEQQVGYSSDVQWNHIDGEGGSISVVNSMLSVTQTAKGHRKIRKLLRSIGNPESIPATTKRVSSLGQSSTSDNGSADRNMIKTLQLLVMIGWLVAIAFAICSLILLSKLAAANKSSKQMPDGQSL